MQIVEEQLSFPSGTATAQLISVLHQLPPPDTSVRRRRGYRQLDPEDDTSVEPAAPPSLAAPDDDAENDVYERETVQNDGWNDLKWSFAFSGFVTVSYDLTDTKYMALIGNEVSCIFLSRHLCDSCVWKLLGWGMVVVFYP